MQGATARHRMVVALSAVLLVIAAACTPAGEPDVGEDDASRNGPDGPAEEPEEDADEDDVLDTLDTIAAQVAALRGLEPEKDIETELVGPDELEDILTDRDRDAEAIERLAASARVLTALRHLEPDAELDIIIDELQSATVVGLYDPHDEVAYVSSDEAPLGPGAATTAAHELVHALQDQHFDLTRLDDIPVDQPDAAMAFLSVVEGDAVLLEEEWAATHQTEEEREEAGRDQLADAQQQLAVLDDVPSYVVETFVFP